MFFSTQFLFPIALFSIVCHATERRFECGPHGRFEYCIDGIPGCVVGCHCHPGYYFDTDSKICEANVKLQQEFRRHYIPEVSHTLMTPANTPIATAPTPTLTPKTRTNLDDKVDEIAKDTDDIGDWLYNQFFKTIENQVINNTNNEKPNKLTRRSGNSPITKKNKKKSRKTWKNSKRKKGKFHGLRRKLLRITEDDSLFDSGSSSDTSDDSGFTSSESDSSDTTSESEGKKDDKDHGHSTILLFNKKPKPPLPSFIFLPHMDTPYYPPIGLPPPPMLPMYPIAPIPPMAPMFPFHGQPPEECNHMHDTATTAATSTSAATTNSLAPSTAPKETVTKNASPKDAVPTEAAPTEAVPDEGVPEETVTKDADAIPDDDGVNPDSQDPSEPTEAPTPANTRTRYNIRRGKKTKKGNFRPKLPKSINIFRTIPNSRSQLMHKVRENMNNRMPLMNQLIENEREYDTPMANDFPSKETYSFSKKMHLRAMEDRIPKMRDVDFKYLSELIHRANLNDTSKVPAHRIAHNGDIQNMINTGQIGRRSYQNDYVQQYAHPTNSFNDSRNLQSSGSDNTFYSNLGRQIATMIRNIDAQGDRQVNIEIERSNPTITHTILNENRYAPRSYWERSVRSPLQYFKEDLEYFNPSNEKLLSLENEVENAANRSPSLSLHDLEDILSTMTKAQFPMQQRAMFDDHKLNTNNTRLNINLLPKHEMSKGNKNMFYETPKQFNEPPKYNKYRSNVTLPKAHNVNTTEGIDTISKNKLSKYSQIGSPSDFWWLDMGKSIPVRTQEINKSISNIHSIYDTRPTRRALTDEISTTVETLQSIPRRHQVEYLKYLKTLSHHPMQQTTKIPNMKYQTQVLNYYFPGANNNYRHDQRPISYTQQFASYSETANNKPVQKFIRRPSYFHHELHHFDYF